MLPAFLGSALSTVFLFRPHDGHRLFDVKMIPIALLGPPLRAPLPFRPQRQCLTTIVLMTLCMVNLFLSMVGLQGGMRGEGGSRVKVVVRDALARKGVIKEDRLLHLSLFLPSHCVENVIDGINI